METNEITTREHLRYLVDRAVEKTQSDNSEHAFIRVTHRFRSDEVHEPKNTDSETVYFTIYNETKRMRIKDLGDSYHIESEISGRDESVLTPEEVVDAIYKDIEQMRLEPCDAPPSNIQEFILHSLEDVHYAVKSVNHDYEVRMESRPVDIPNSVAVDISMLSAKTTIGFTRYEPNTRPDTDKGCIDERQLAAYERSLVAWDAVEHDSSRLSYHKTVNLNDVDFETAVKDAVKDALYHVSREYRTDMELKRREEAQLDISDLSDDTQQSELQGGSSWKKC